MSISGGISLLVETLDVLAGGNLGLWVWAYNGSLGRPPSETVFPDWR